MSRLLTMPRVMTFATMFVASFASTVQAQYDRSLYRVADDYRDAVSDFEREARRLDDRIDRLTLRLIDRLEDASGDLRSAARRTDDPIRLQYEFNEVQSLQVRVEQAVFGSGCPIISRALLRHWNEVLVTFNGLQYRMQFIQPVRYDSRYPAHGVPVPGCGIQESYLPPATRRSASRVDTGSLLMQAFLTRAFR
ncbi:MAG: hypothetical protein AAGJ40_10900 [Planctomycetota bacterium]